MDDLDVDIYDLFLRPDVGVNHAALYNIEKSYKTLMANIPTIYGISKHLSDKYIVTWSNPKTYLSEPSYIAACLKNRPYDIVIEYDLTVSSKNEVNTTKQYKTRQEIRIPALVCYHNELITGESGRIDEKTIGGFFIGNNATKKFISNSKKSKSVIPKAKKINKCFCLTFNSIPLYHDLDNTRIQYVVLELCNTDSNFRFNFKTSKLFISCNILILICYLYNNKPLNVIKKIIMSVFDDNIKEAVDFIFLETEVIINKHIRDDTDDKYANAYSSYLHDETHKFIVGKELNEGIREAFDRLLNELFPHLNDDINSKIFYLIFMVREFIFAHFQHEVYPSRDNLIGRRITTPGALIQEKLIESQNKCIQDINKTSKKNSNLGVITSKLTFDQETNKLINNIMNKKEKSTLKLIKDSSGITSYFDIQRPNLITNEGSLQLTNVLNSRNIDLSTAGFEDLVDTPESSGSIGLAKRISITTRITSYTFNEFKTLYEDIRRIILETTKNIIKPTKPIMCSIVDMSCFPINFLTNEECDELIEKIKEYKHKNYCNFQFVGIERVPIYKFDKYKQVYLPTNKCAHLKFNISNSRYYRPYIVAKNIKNIKNIDISKYKRFSELTEEEPGLIEYLDPAQVEYSNIYYNYKEYLTLDNKDEYDYVELPSAGNFGVVAASSFDYGRNLGYRAIVGISQQKHSLSQMTSDAFNRFESGHALLPPYESPCVSNNVLEIWKISEMGKGHHLNVAFFSGVDNVEDAIILRRSARDRGALDAITLTAFKSNANSMQLRAIVPRHTNNNYSKLSPSGLYDPYTVIVKNDAIHKRINIDNDEGYDNSEAYALFTPGRVERVLKYGMDEVNINLLLSSYKPAEVGDKFVNQGAQKGTIGIIYDDYQLPHTEDGSYPDIVFNSISGVSRQTYSLFFQLVLTELSRRVRDPIDYQTFTNLNIEDFINFVETKSPGIIESMSYTVYNEYGIPYKNKMIMGPLMYNRSMQMSIDNISLRDSNILDTFGNPVSGRKRGGGQRSGEMEVDLLKAHRASNILYETISDIKSNNFNTKVCNECGTFVTKEMVNNKTRWYCIPCQNRKLTPDINTVNITQASKAAMVLLRCRGINMQIVKGDDPRYYITDIEN